jgi:hypothetical protein
MANKEFGVKKIELIGSSGVPKLSSPTDLNINANTVAISTDVTIGGKIQSDVIVGSGYSVGIGSTQPQQVLDVTGTIRATNFVGDGSLLDNVGGGTTSEWTLGADGFSNFTFTGPGLTGAESDPPLYLIRGQSYRFTSTLGATHPFRIQSTPNGSTGTQYNDGITNNDLQNGTLVWDVQFDAPKILYYQCTNHGNMGGPIYILGEDEVSPSYTDVNVSGALTVSQGRIQANAASNLRFGNVAAGSGSGRNIAIGDQVLVSLSGGSGRNIGIGELSYYDTTTGQYNIGIGERAGQKVSTGSYNVILGAYDGNSVNLDIRTSSNNVVIADGEGNIRQYINSSGNVGIKTTVVTEALTVAGIISATSFYGTLNAGQLTGALPALDGSALTGVSAVGSGIEVKDNGSAVGAAATVDFSTGLDVSAVSAGVVTITADIPGISTTGTSGFNNLNASGDVDVDGHTELDNLNVSGVATFQSNVNLGDSDKAVFGTDNDFEIYHDGSNGYIDNATGELYIRDTNAAGTNRIFIQPKSGENGIIAYEDGQVELYYDNDIRFQTATGGITVYGDVTLSGSGSQFTGSGAGLTSIPSNQLTGALPAIDGSALLNVNATGDGVVVEDSGVNIGSAKTINFDTGLDVTYSSGIATVTASGGSLQTRTIVSASTTSIADNAVGLVTVTGFKSYALMKVGLSTAGWIRIYTDSESRTADSSRSVGEDPAAGSGVIAEVVTTGISTEQKISPFTIGGNMNDPVDATIYMAITNLSGTTQSINANLTILQLEA